ncbi:MAG TPA: hypothetical protein VM451_08185 [Candidatus Limnocylindria bacterium]|nr:hypothetical protein [Candidatus Limnocylindria bacterium]
MVDRRVRDPELGAGGTCLLQASDRDGIPVLAALAPDDASPSQRGEAENTPSHDVS